MRIDVWSDVLCPFCHLGRRHLELAIEQFPQAEDLEVIWHSYQLDRNAPAVEDGSVAERVAAKYGRTAEQVQAQHEAMAADAAAVGLDFRWDLLRGGNSFDAHRVIHFARAHALEKPVTDAIMHAWYSKGAAIGDRTVLTDLAAGAGLDRAAVEELLAGDDYGIEVRTDEALAAQIGITAVPTFVLDQKFAVQGAQPVATMLASIEHAYADRGNRPEAAEGGACGGDCCGGVCGDVG